jgi:hypothetical protein
VGFPIGFLKKYQGTNAPKFDDMAVIKAMLTLPAKDWAPANVSGIGERVSVSPSYAAKLATVGVTPRELLAWLYADVPPSERAPWIPGSANAPPGIVKSVAEAIHLAPKPHYAPPPKPGPAYPTVPRSANGVTTHRAASLGEVAAGRGTSACPPGEAVTVAPNGATCLPSSALGSATEPATSVQHAVPESTPPARTGQATSHPPARATRPTAAHPTTGRRGSGGVMATHRSVPAKPSAASLAPVARTGGAGAATIVTVARALPHLWETWLAAYVLLMVGGVALLRRLARR